MGHVINIGSIAGRESYPGGSVYCATKAAVRAFTGCLLREVVDTTIRVTEIQPGAHGRSHDSSYLILSPSYALL
jgi:3-hydroxy acid dehydrogenase/malonic semialdehyde reductase